MKKILLTGATGFIGRHCLPFLKERGFEIHHEKIDLLDPHQVDTLLATIKPTHLLHFAWHVPPGTFWHAPENTLWLHASQHLLNAFKASGGKRAVMAGTSAEYHPKTLYGSCKHSLQETLSQSAISHAWGRIFHLYGPHEKPNRLVPSVIHSLLQGKEALCTHGNQIRDFSHVEDIARAFADLLDSDLQGPLDIASGKPIAVKDLVNLIGRELKREDLIRLGALDSPPGDPPLLIANIDRLTKELHWSPRYSLVDGLQQTINWWKNFTG